MDGRIRGIGDHGKLGSSIFLWKEQRREQEGDVVIT
jgi:hypothetical protein